MTAVEKAIERLTNLHLAIPANTKENRSIKDAYVHCVIILKEYLEMEKQQIIAAVEWNYKSNMGEVYYNALYKNEQI